MNSSGTDIRGACGRPFLVRGTRAHHSIALRFTTCINYNDCRSRQSCAAPLASLALFAPSFTTSDSARNSAAQRYPRRAVTCAASGGGRGGKQRSSEMPDYWAMLEVPRGAGSEAVKEAYRRLQKVYHPDRAMSGSTERSQQLNEAYAMLTEMSSAELVSYERELRLRGPAGPTLKDAAGLVGPIRESELLVTESLPECEAGCDINGVADMVDFVRQWAQTLTYSSELPLPLPLQCDSIEGGARLGFIAIRRGTITMVGELLLTVIPADECEGDECYIDSPLPAGIAVGDEPQDPGAAGGFVPWVVAVKRRGASEPLLGEKRILRSFREACRMHRDRIEGKEQGWQLGGVLAALAQAALGGVPLLGGGSRSYEAYHLKRQRPREVSN